MKLRLEAKAAQGCAVAGGFPPQGTLYWGFLRIWDDGTHDITIPAVKDATGCGHDLESALQDIREKLVSVVEVCCKRLANKSSHQTADCCRGEGRSGYNR